MKSKRIWDKLNVGTAIAAAALLLTFAAQRAEAQLIPLVEWTFDGNLDSNIIDPSTVSSSSSATLIGSASHFNDGNGSPITPLTGSSNTSLGYIFTPGPGNGFSASATFSSTLLSNELAIYFDINTFGSGLSDFIISGTYNGGTPFSSTSITPVVVPTSGPPEWIRVYIPLSSTSLGTGVNISDITLDAVANTSGVVSRIDGAGLAIIPEPSVSLILAALGLVALCILKRKISMKLTINP